MSNPFDIISNADNKEPNYDEWGGQFACQQTGCQGWANIARYFKKEKSLAWKCQYSHVSTMEDVNE